MKEYEIQQKHIHKYRIIQSIFLKNIVMYNSLYFSKMYSKIGLEITVR